MNGSHALRAVIYTRLSPSPRGDAFKGGNLDQQAAMCRARCEENGWEVVRVIQDRDASAVSGKPRPGWRTLLQMVEKHEVDVVIGRHYDRLYRRPVDLEELIRLTEDTGVRIVAAEGDSLGIDLTTATGLLQARILVAFAAGETDIKRERQRAGQRRRVDAGLPWWGNRPFGYETDLSIRESEAEHIRNAYQAVLEGVSITSLVREWNDRGLLTVKGGPWCVTTVRRLLAHPRNAALVVYDGLEVEVEAAWQPLVDTEIYRAVAQLVGRRGSTSAEPFVRRGVLTGIATCAVRHPDGSLCGGAVMLGTNRPRSDGSQLRKYVCNACHRASFPADLLEDYVMAVLFHRSSHQRLHQGPSRSGQYAEAEAARGAVAELRARKDQLRDLFLSGDITTEDYIDGNRVINQRTMEARTRLAAAQMRRPAEDAIPIHERGFSDLVRMYCDMSRHDELRSIIREEVVSLAITPGTHLRKWRTIDEIVASWRDPQDVPTTYVLPVGSQAWSDAQVQMAAARSVWAERRLARKVDLITRHGASLLEVRHQAGQQHPDVEATAGSPH